MNLVVHLFLQRNDREYERMLYNLLDTFIIQGLLDKAGQLIR